MLSRRACVAGAPLVRALVSGVGTMGAQPAPACRLLLIVSQLALREVSEDTPSRIWRIAGVEVPPRKATGKREAVCDRCRRCVDMWVG